MQLPVNLISLYTVNKLLTSEITESLHNSDSKYHVLLVG
jgi:hypothetical protein